MYIESYKFRYNIETFDTIFQHYRIYTTVCITPPWGLFSNIDYSTSKRVPIIYRTIRFRKASGKTFPPPTLSAPTTVPTAVDTWSLEYRPKAGVIYAVVYIYGTWAACLLPYRYHTPSPVGRISKPKFLQTQGRGGRHTTNMVASDRRMSRLLQLPQRRCKQLMISSEGMGCCYRYQACSTAGLGWAGL